MTHLRKNCTALFAEFKRSKQNCDHRITLANLKGRHAESEEAQEHANSSSLALYA